MYGVFLSVLVKAYMMSVCNHEQTSLTFILFLEERGGGGGEGGLGTDNIQKWQMGPDFFLLHIQII